MLNSPVSVPKHWHHSCTWPHPACLNYPKLFYSVGEFQLFLSFQIKSIRRGCGNLIKFKDEFSITSCEGHGTLWGQPAWEAGPAWNVVGSSRNGCGGSGPDWSLCERKQTEQRDTGSLDAGHPELSLHPLCLPRPQKPTKGKSRSVERLSQPRLVVYCFSWF